MRFSRLFIFSLVLVSGVLSAQTTTRAPYVRAVGQATVSVKPDQGQIDFSIVTQGTTAKDASSQNAVQVSNVLAQLQALLGPNADIKTVNYSLSPNYIYPQNGGTPTLTGYTATNTVRVTTGDLTTIGSIIDTGVQAGANQVSSLQFGLKNSDPAQAQALRMATAQAKTHADAMAAGGGLHTGSFFSIEEGVTVRPISGLGAPSAAPSTPIVTGLVDVQATVTVQVDLVP